MLTPDDNTPETELRRLIRAGVPGTRLPSVRELARRHGASPVTIQSVVSRLEHEGLVEPSPGRGTFIARRPPAAAGDWAWQTTLLGSRPIPGEGMAGLAADVNPDVISLASGYPDASLQALTLLATATARAGRRPSAWSRSPAEGIADLREWFAADIGGGVRATDVVVIPGGQAALSAAFRGLASPGDTVVMESPTYVGALDAARLAGLVLAPVPADADGMRADLLDATLRTTGAKLVYVQPHAANPTGVTTSAERRRAMLDVVSAHGAFVIEDDYARDLAFGGQPPPPLLHGDVDGHVIYVRSLTKSTAPALRIAALVARGPALRRLRNARLVDDFFVSAMLQETALEVVGSAGWPRHIRRMQRAIAERMDVAVSALAAEPGLDLAVRPTAGLVLWVSIDDALDDQAIVQAARDAGVAVTAGRSWFASEPSGSFLRLSVASAEPAAVAAGIAVLGEVVRTR